MSISLEHVLGDDAVRRNFEKLASLTVDTGGQTVGIRFGSGSVTWPGGNATSNTATITHGLGKAPSVAFLTNKSHTTFTGLVTNVTSTTFDVIATTTDGSTPALGASRTFYWLVIG